MAALNDIIFCLLFLLGFFSTIHSFYCLFFTSQLSPFPQSFNFSFLVFSTLLIFSLSSILQLFFFLFSSFYDFFLSSTFHLFLLLSSLNSYAFSLSSTLYSFLSCLLFLLLSSFFNPSEHSFLLFSSVLEFSLQLFLFLSSLHS